MRGRRAVVDRVVGPAAVILAGLLAIPACDRTDAAPPPPVSAAAERALPGPQGTLAPISDSAFGALVAALSEPGGYFDTDNLISNESSYLHVIQALEDRGVRGGAYVGVGPAQNFSYVVAIRPELAFMMDIRRDNALQHLWFKALFERAETRLDYLCLMTARECGALGVAVSGDGALEGSGSDGSGSASLGLEALVRRVEAAPPVDSVDALIERVLDHAAAAGVALNDRDRAFIRSVHRRFAEAGLGLRFNSHGRAPRPDYPTLRRLLLERDDGGRQTNYLATEAGYRYLRALQQANRVVPVVGDLAGDHAVRAIGAEVGRRGLEVTGFYTSNVEFYLFGDRTFPAWMANLAALPASDDGVIIRSYFNRFRPHPRTVPGYASTQLLQTIPALLADWEEGRVRSYVELVGR